jgi:hypothetical protein
VSLLFNKLKYDRLFDLTLLDVCLDPHGLLLFWLIKALCSARSRACEPDRREGCGSTSTAIYEHTAARTRAS